MIQTVSHINEILCTLAINLKTVSSSSSDAVFLLTSMQHLSTTFQPWRNTKKPFEPFPACGVSHLQQGCIVVFSAFSKAVPSCRSNEYDAITAASVTGKLAPTARARTGDKWHLDEVFLKINGVTHYLWRATDQNGVVLDIRVQPKWDRFAAIRFFRKLLRATARKPRVIITDKPRSYGAAKRVVMPGVSHRQHRYLNNRAENSHQPARERERRMRRFKSARHAQWFVEVHGIVASHFRPRRHLLSAAITDDFVPKDSGFGMK
jgi:transposase-like protein